MNERKLPRSLTYKRKDTIHKASQYTDSTDSTDRQTDGRTDGRLLSAIGYKLLSTDS